jgi:hypothetical protein
MPTNYQRVWYYWGLMNIASALVIGLRLWDYGMLIPQKRQAFFVGKAKFKPSK